MKIFKNRKNYGPIQGPDREYWLGRSTAVVALIVGYTNWSPYILISRRGSEAYDNIGKWCLPCGYLDWDESGSDAAKREAWEEVGVDVDDIQARKHILSASFDQPWRVKTDPSENRQNISLVYGLKFGDNVDDITPIANNVGDTKNEVSDALWMPYGELKKYDFVYGHDTLIKTYIEE
jgi:8-oxo-dGTP diphosphatase